MGERTERDQDVLLNVCQREPLTRGEPVRAGLVCVGVPLPQDPARAALAMELDAAQIADLLWDTLPGGTLDMLIVELMGRRASVLRVGLLSVDEIVALQRARSLGEDAPQVSGNHGETTTGAAGGADTPASAEGTGERVD